LEEERAQKKGVNHRRAAEPKGWKPLQWTRGKNPIGVVEKEPKSLEALSIFPGEDGTRGEGRNILLAKNKSAHHEILAQTEGGYSLIGARQA